MTTTSPASASYEIGVERWFFAIAQGPSLFPGLPVAYKSLFNHFYYVADSFSCDQHIKDEFCATFIPMAVADSHVLAAVLTLAAVHRANVGLSQSKQQLAMLQMVSIQQLRLKLSAPPEMSLLAVVLMLCYSEVIGGRGHDCSWRLHLEGIAALFRFAPATWAVDSEDRPRAFISRCFVSLVALANVSAVPPTEAVAEQALRIISCQPITPFIDDFTAYSADLLRSLFEIGALIRDAQRENGMHTCLEERSLRLIQQLRGMIDTSSSSLKHQLGEHLPLFRTKEYLYINEAYHHAAVIQLHLRIRQIPPSADIVQIIVRRVLSLLSRVEIHNGPCLGILLFFPIFSAGCGAIRATDRNQVRSLLGQMAGMVGFLNLKQGLQSLERLWSGQDLLGESRTNRSWVEFVGKSFNLAASVRSH